ncbi:MAG: 4-alpha-glucanotransferase [Clostridia bacterium]|nr:4-alpha-glucanotransferase [Clostridia bacterium]
MKRASGVLLPAFSLPGDYSVGSFGREAKKFVDFLYEGGFSWWQVLPFCLPGAGNSPYKSYSAFSYNYAFVDLPTLYDEGLLTRAELEGARGRGPYVCEYDRMENERFALLSRAAARFTDRAAVYDFLQKNPATEQFCRFMALRRANDDRPWREFVTDRFDESYYYAWAFTQYAFCRQFDELHRYAAARGVRIMGDIPIYVDYESADVYESRHLFLLRQDNTPAAVAGVPPDYFCEDGQLWGNPLYDWEAMQAENYAWWRGRLRHTLSLFDGVRIDHFRAFASYFSIPAGAETAKEGSWKVGPGEELVDRLREVAGDALIVAEDLGGESSDVRKLLSYSGFPGMRVLQFAFLGDMESLHLPHHYPHNSVAYTGTHDNDTLLGYLFSMPEERRRHVFRYCGYNGEDMHSGFTAVLRTMYASHAGLLVLPVQDLLRFGEDTRINRPGTPSGNWGYRLTEEQLGSLDPAPFRTLSNLYGR